MFSGSFLQDQIKIRWQDMGMMMDSFDDLEGSDGYYNDGGNGYGGTQ